MVKNELDKVKIQNILVGQETSNIDIVVITPIGTAFRKMCEILGIKENENKSFFKTACFENNRGTKGMIVHIPQGVGAQDIMYVFKGVDIIFYGYAGGLDESIPIGSIVEVDSAIGLDGEIIPVCQLGNYRRIKCGYSPCLLGRIATYYSEKARIKGCQVVDMETVYCAKAAIENNNRLKALLVISDIPGTMDFWNLNEETKFQFKKGKEEIIWNIILYLNSFIKVQR